MVGLGFGRYINYSGKGYGIICRLMRVIFGIRGVVSFIKVNGLGGCVCLS